MARLPDGAAFARPEGEPALVPPDSVSWRIFKDPLALFNGGVAAMVTVYSARSVAEAMIANVVRLHDRVTGATPAGEACRASDVRLFTWVQATASFGFIEAYRRYARPLSPAEIDRAYDDAAPVARLYGALDAPRSDAERQSLFTSMRERLEPSPIVFEFLGIMNSAAIVPWLLRPAQRLLVRAAVEAVPGWLRERLGLASSFGLRPWQVPLVRLAGAVADRIVVRCGPAAQSCRRLGLPADYLYRQQ